MAGSDQKTLKVSIHSFPAWRSTFKRVSVEMGQQVRLLCPSARHLTRLPLSLSGVAGTSNRWQLDSKTKKVPSLYPGQDTLTNKWVPKP